MRYFTSDLHLGHRAIPKYRTRFKSLQEHDDFIIDKILSLRKRDILYILGDFLFDGEHYDEYIKRLSQKKCRIKLIMGNHDSLKLYKEDIFEMQLPFFSYKNYWVGHVPIHPQEMRNRLGNIHGHLHLEHVKSSKYNHTLEKYEDDKRYFNVNIDVCNYEFVVFEDIEKYFKGVIDG